MASGYAITAQYFDAMAGEAHAGVDAQIAEALAGLDAAPGPVIDVGAGTGLTSRVIASALPQAEIWAIEPDPAMRPALMTRVWSDLDLRRRVTILPMTALEAPLPPVIAGAVLSASLVHFSPEDRRRLWTLLRSRLAASGRIVVELQCPEAVDLPETVMANSRIGRILYEGRAQALRVAADRQLWRMSYRALLDGEEIAVERCDYECWTISADHLALEAAAAGLRARLNDPLVILEPA